MSPSAQNVIDRLDQLRQKWWVFTLLSSGVWAVSASFSLFLLLTLADTFFRLSQFYLALGLGLWLTVSCGLLAFVVRRVLVRQRTLEGAARCLEAEHPELESHLINLVQLSHDTANVDQNFCRAAVDQAALSVAQFPFERVSSKESRLRRFLYSLQTPRDFCEACVFLLFLCVLASLGHSFFPNWSSAANRLATPW